MNSQLSVASASASRMIIPAPPMDPTWFPSLLLTLGMQGTRETPGRSRRFCSQATPSPLAPLCQGELTPTGSPVQYSVHLFSITLHETVGDSFLPKAFLSIPRTVSMQPELKANATPRRLQYPGKWYFCRHRGSCYRSRCCEVAGKQHRNAYGCCRQGIEEICPPSGPFRRIRTCFSK